MGRFSMDEGNVNANVERQSKRAASLCVREEYERALDVYEEILEEDPDCIEAYIGIVRARSEGYAKLESPEIDKAVRVANKILPDDFEDEDYLLFLKRRKRAIADREEIRILEAKKQEEAQKKAQEETRRKAAEDAARKTREEAQKKAQEEAKKKAEKERLLALCAPFRFEKTGPNSVRLVKCVDKSLTKVAIPDCDADGNAVTEIGAHAFFECSSLASVAIPGGVKIIGKSAFANRASLTSVSIPSGVAEIGEHAFYGCSSLASLAIPGGVKTIGKCAFANCTKLTSVSIPSSL